MSDPRFLTHYLNATGNQHMGNTQPQQQPLPARLAYYHVSHPQQPVRPILIYDSSHMTMPLQATEQFAQQSQQSQQSQQFTPYASTGMNFQNISLLQQQVQTFVIPNQTSMHTPLQASYPPPPDYSTESPFHTQPHPALYYEESTATDPITGSFAGGQISHAPVQSCKDQQASELLEVERIVKSSLKPDAKEFHPRTVAQEINTPLPCPSGSESYIPPDGSASPSRKPDNNNETATNASGELEEAIESMSDIDISQLLPSSTRKKPDIDPDMRHLYCLSQQQPQRSHKKAKNKELSKIQSNMNMFYDTQANGYNERQKIIKSLSEGIDKNQSSTVMLLPPPSPTSSCIVPNTTHQQTSEQSSAKIIYLSVMPYLPYTCSKTLTFSAPPLTGYSIPFSTDSFSLTSESIQQTGAITKNKQLQLINTKDQLILISSRFLAMINTFSDKIDKLKQTENRETKNSIQWDLLIHSKYIAHMMLTALLLLDHDSSAPNPEILQYITAFFISHINIIMPEKDISEDAYLELMRATLCLLNHSIAESNILPAMMNLKETETKAEKQGNPTRKLTTKKRLQKKIQTRKGTAPGSDETDESETKALQKITVSNIQILLIDALSFFSNKPKLVTYYFSILNTIYKLPIFCKEFLSDNPDAKNKIIQNLKNFIRWMNHNLKSLSYYDKTLSENKAIIQEIETWILKLSKLIATLAGRTPERDKEITDIQWLQENFIKNPKIKTSDKTDTTSKLKSLAIDIEELQTSIVTAKLEDYQISRQFDEEADTWAKRMDQLTKLSQKRKDPESNQKANQQSVMVKEPDAAASLKSAESIHYAAREPISGVTDFTDTVTSLCKTLDGSDSFENLKKITEDRLAEGLIPPAHKVYCFLEIGLHMFHNNHRLIIPTAKSMDKVHTTYQKLVSLKPPAREKITRKYQSTQWLQQHYSTNELTLKNMALMARNTDLEVVKKAKERLRNSLLFLNLSIQYGQELLNEITKGNLILQGELKTTELISHFEICQDLITPLTCYNEALHRKLVTHELSTLKVRLFEKLRLYGLNSFKSPANHFSPESAARVKDEDVMKPLRKMQQNKEKYDTYNLELDDNDKINTLQLLHNFTQVHNGLKSFLENNAQGNLTQS